MTPDTPVAAAKIVCIDPGHETTQITDPEPVAPGSAETKPGVSSGTEGVASGKTEYQVNLEVSLLLRDMLEARGYQVVMTRTENDVRLSNVDRAKIATAANADIFVRIHCNGLDNPEINGTLCYGPTENNPYLGDDARGHRGNGIYEQCAGRPFHGFRGGPAEDRDGSGKWRRRVFRGGVIVCGK